MPPIAVHRQAGRRRIVRKAARRHSQAANHNVTRRRPVARRIVTHHSSIARRTVTHHTSVARHRVTPSKKVAHRVHKPARRAAPRGLLSVVWPGGLLRFDQRQALRVHTLPGAHVTVMLRIERIATPHSLGPRGPRVVLIPLYARANRYGDASVPLRYAYVPTRPTPATIVVTVYDGRRVERRSATITLVRR